MPTVALGLVKSSRVPLLPGSRRSRVQVVSVALALAIAAVAITYASDPLATGSTFLLSFAAVTFAGWYGGTLGGLVATAATALLIDVSLLNAPGSVGLHAADVPRFATFVALSLLATGFNGSLHSAAHRLRESEHLGRLIVDSAPMLIAAADPAGRVALFNRECERLTGHTAKDVIGAPFVDTLVPTDWRSSVTSRFATQSDAEIAMAHRNPWTMADGSERLIEWRCYRLITPAGLATIGLGHDVTERERKDAELRDAMAAAEQAREEASAAVAARDRFIAVLSHELRSPVAAAMGSTELLLSQATTPDMRRLLERIHRSHQLMFRLLDDVQDLARIESGKVSLKPRHIRLNEVIASVIDAAGTVAVRKGVSIVNLVADDLLVWGDPDRLHQAASNMLNNAVKFSEPGGAVVVRAVGQHQSIRLTVEDDGPGISEADAARVFEPFWQSDSDKGGLGLGLAVVQQIATLHGGTAHIRRARPEGGTIVGLTLPMVEGAEGQVAG